MVNRPSTLRRPKLHGSTVRDTTAISHEPQVRLRIIPRIGGIRLQDVDAKDLDKLYRDPERAGRVSGGPLAPESVRTVHEVLFGHASASIALDVYSQVLPTDDRDTAARTAAFILGS